VVGKLTWNSVELEVVDLEFRSDLWSKTVPPKEYACAVCGQYPNSRVRITAVAPGLQCTLIFCETCITLTWMPEGETGFIIGGVKELPAIT
jgi:hypothetical protein